MAAFSSMCSRRLVQLVIPGTRRHINLPTFLSLHLRTISRHSCSPVVKLLSASNKSRLLSETVCVVGPVCCQGRLSSTDISQRGQTAPENGKAASNGGDGKKKDSWFSGKNAWKLGLLSLAGMSVLMAGNLLFLWGAPLKDKEGNEIPDEFTILPTWQAYPKRAMKEFHFFKKMIQEPSSPKLLPDPLQEPYYQPPYTLVLELTGVLVHPDWTLSTGWRFKKRPGVELFLQQVGPPLFEVVIYTKEQGFTAFPIIDGLDPNGNISFRLFRDATRYMSGHHVKDLSCLNRDLSKVIIVDCDQKSFQLQPNNAFFLRKWKGSDDDRTLVDLAQFLRTVATSGVEDIRPVLEYYSQFDNPLEVFKQNQIRLQEEQVAKAESTSQKKSLASSWSMGLYGRRKGS